MSREFANRLSLSRHAHNRDSSRRVEADTIANLMALPTTRVVVVRANTSLGRVIVDSETGDERVELEYFSPSRLDNLDARPIALVYLGRSHDGDESYLAAVLHHEDTFAPDPALTWCDLRRWGHVMSERDTGLFTQALALAHWHVSHEYSPATGEPTVPTSSGWVRTTPSNEQVFPRTDIAVIALVTDSDNRLLLGNNKLWEPQRFSLLAGFVDPGESLEAAVVREVFEESGVHVDYPEYLGSQPWPFPASLMVGFHARVREGVDPNLLIPDGEEIAQLRWFTRDEIRDGGDQILLPGKTSIARSLIEHWFGEPISRNDSWLGVR